MTGPNVQVPVSLIERAIRGMETEDYDGEAVRELRALLSQPTPTAEPFDSVSASCVSVPRPEQDDETAAPPNIADIVPGTRLRAHERNVEPAWRWDGHCLHRPDGVVRAPEDIDPSTIRDVQAPKET